MDATVPATVQADTAGVITLTDLPATGFTLVVRPYDVDGDGFFECCSSANALTLTPGSTTLANITLPVEVGTPAVTYSNVDGLGGTPLQEPALIVVYSAPMDTSPARTNLILTRQGFPNDPLPMTWRWTSPVRLEVRSASPLNDESAYYNVWISAVSTRGARIQWVSDFYWLTPGGPQDGCDEEVTGFVLTPGHRIDYDTGLSTWTGTRWPARVATRSTPAMIATTPDGSTSAAARTTSRTVRSARRSSFRSPSIATCRT